MNFPFWRRPLFQFVVLIALLASCSASRTIVWNIPGQTDFKKFPSVEVKRAGKVTPVVEDFEKGIPSVEQWAIGPPYQPGMTAEALFNKTGTEAFLVLRNDTLLYEYYGKGFDLTSVFTSFSLVKIYVSTLVGIAIDEGFIDSLDQKASDFLPELKRKGLDQITIHQLLEMQSGIKSSESLYNPFGTSVKMYYCRHLGRMMETLKLQNTPGSKFKYQNINTQLLSMILARTTGKPVSQYLQEKIWEPLGMESDASWSLDRKDGEVKAFCCLNARARDFARFGILFADSGRWNGTQLVPLDYLKLVFREDSLGEKNQRYRMHWYTSGENEDYYGEGLLGQFIYVYPKGNLVIVRLGNGIHTNVKWYSMFKFIAGIEPKPFEKPIAKSDLVKFEGSYQFGKSSTGDVSMQGSMMRVKASGKGLKIFTGKYPAFHVYYAGNHTFYNVRNARKITFYQNESGRWDVNWYRRGNSWDLKKTDPVQRHLQ